MEAQFNEELMETTFLFCYKRIADKETARDISQEIILSALIALRKKKQIENFHAWYWQLANHKVIDFYRRGKKNIISIDELVSLGTDDDTLENLISQEETEQISTAISRLAKIHRDIVIRFYLQKQSVKQIAKELNIPTGTVTGRLSDARKDLHKRMSVMKKKIKPKKHELMELTFFWKGKAMEKTMSVNSLLRQQILFDCRMKKKSIDEIGEDIGANPVYIEQDINELLNCNLLYEPVKGKYLADAIFFPYSAAERAVEELKKCYAKHNYEERFFTTLLALKDKLPSEDMFGNSFTFEQLLPVYAVIGTTLITSISQKKILSNHPELTDRFFRFSFMSGQYYENSRQEKKDVLLSELGYGYPDFFVATGNYRLLQFHNTIGWYKTKTYNERFCLPDFEKIISDYNADLIIALSKNPAMQLDEKQKEIAANLIETGLASLTEKGIRINFPVFSNELKKSICKTILESLIPLATEISDEFITIVDEIFLPYTREDLTCAYYNLFIQILTNTSNLILDYGIKHKHIVLEKDLSHSVAGLFLEIYTEENAQKELEYEKRSTKQ